MTPIEANRRRFLTGLVALACSSLQRASKVSAQDLPLCKASLSIGNWYVHSSLWEGDPGKASDAWTYLNAKRVALRYELEEELVTLSHDITASADVYDNLHFTKRTNQLTVPWSTYLKKAQMTVLRLNQNAEGKYVKTHTYKGRVLTPDQFSRRYFLGDQLWIKAKGVTATTEETFQQADLFKRLASQKNSTLRGQMIDEQGTVTGTKGKVLFEFETNLNGLRNGYKLAAGQEQQLVAQEKAKTCQADIPYCFLTTACCATLGLDDTCWELTTLRRFRDNVLATWPGGKDEIKTYYETAPRLVQAIHCRPDSTELFLKAYYLYILPCALGAWLGLNKATHRHYKAMMQHLTTKAMPERSGKGPAPLR